AEFVEHGFAYDSAGNRWFNGPDADVMLDDAFARGYCFQMAAAQADRPSQIGLAFSPATRQRSRIDIEGAVWIDSASRTLTDIVFKYVGVTGEQERLKPGGRTLFRSMSNGVVLIDRWSLRFAVPAATLQTRMTARQMASVPLEVHETGAEVAEARWP